MGADGETEATWEVLRLIPEIREDMRGWFIAPGDTGPFDSAPGTANEEVSLYETHDGKFVRITYFLNRYDSVEDAEEDADRNGAGGVLAYDLMNDVWGFPSADPDQYLDITVSGCVCIFGGDQVRIFMPPNVLEWVNQFGFTYTDADELAYRVITHEFFLHFQGSLMQWNQPNWVLEGTARFIETITWPSQAHQPGSIQYAGGCAGPVRRAASFRRARHGCRFFLTTLGGPAVYGVRGERIVTGSAMAATASFPGFSLRFDAAVSPGGHQAR